jgi:hypothetical protein
MLRLEMKAHRGILILALGIVSLAVLCLPLGILVWIMADNDLKQMDAGTMAAQGRAKTMIGRVCGMIATLLLGLCLLVALVSGTWVVLKRATAKAPAATAPAAASERTNSAPPQPNR